MHMKIFSTILLNFYTITSFIFKMLEKKFKNLKRNPKVPHTIEDIST